MTDMRRRNSLPGAAVLALVLVVLAVAITPAVLFLVPVVGLVLGIAWRGAAPGSTQRQLSTPLIAVSCVAVLFFVLGVALLGPHTASAGHAATERVRGIAPPPTG